MNTLSMTDSMAQTSMSATGQLAHRRKPGRLAAVLSGTGIFVIAVLSSLAGASTS